MSDKLIYGLHYCRVKDLVPGVFFRFAGEVTLRVLVKIYNREIHFQIVSQRRMSSRIGYRKSGANSNQFVWIVQRPDDRIFRSLPIVSLPLQGLANPDLFGHFKIVFNGQV